MNPHILKQVEAYLILRMMDVERKGREWYAYMDALTLIEEAQVRMQDAFEIEWEKMKA